LAAFGKSMLARNAVLREPLVHFLIAGALIFAVDAIRGHCGKPLLELNASEVQTQVTAAETRLKRPLTPPERDRIVQELLSDELLFREAQRRGMLSDNRVRGTLVQMMRSALRPVEAPPDAAQLEAVRARLPAETSTLPEQISFEHVSFTTAQEVPPGLLLRLRSGTPPPPSSDAVRLTNPFPETYRTQVERLLSPEFAATVFALPKDEWHGPLPSTRGVHFVRVISKVKEQPVPMDQLRPILESYWRQEQENQAVAREVQGLKSGYRMILP
jgi:hypothetical protein